MTPDLWRQALATRGLVAAKVRHRLEQAHGARVELDAPDGKPERIRFTAIVSAVAARLYGTGNYRLETLRSPPRLAVWRLHPAPGMVSQAALSHRAQRFVRDYFERRL